MEFKVFKFTRFVFIHFVSTFYNEIHDNKIKLGGIQYLQKQNFDLFESTTSKQTR